MRGPLSLAIGFALTGSAAFAAPATVATPESVVEFTVNGQEQVATLVVRRDAGGAARRRWHAAAAG